jgi:hypothetical protein
MKQVILLFIAFLLFLSKVNAQELKILETVHLNNGSRISGFITEQVPGGNYTIETGEGNLFVFPESDINRITREVLTIDPNMGLDYKRNYREIGFTFGTPSIFNFLFGVNRGSFHSHIGLSIPFTKIMGLQFNSSYILTQSKDFRHYIGLSGGLATNNDSGYGFIGPVYSLNVLTIMIEVGAGYGCIDRDCGLTPHFQVGFNPRFNRIK